MDQIATDIQKPIDFQEPRRKDRAMRDETWIEDLLSRVPVGVFATSNEDGYPSLNPNLFVYDPEACAIYLHTAKTGRTRSNIDARPQASFCVSEMGRLLPADAAVHFSVEYASVVLEGRVSIIEQVDEATRVLDLLMRKYAPDFESGKDYRGISEKDLARTTVFKLAIESWTGKGKMSDATDAYDYRPSKVT